MIKQTKEQIKEYLSKKTMEIDFLHPEIYTTTAIADSIHVSRSVTSQYLNELVEENEVIKVKSRPVYFLCRKTLEKKYRIPTKNMDFIDLEDLRSYIVGQEGYTSLFHQLGGFEGNLATKIRALIDIFEYPPNGLPIVIYGHAGVGKSTIAKLICDNSMMNHGVLGKGAIIKKFEIDGDEDGLLRSLKKIDESKQQTVIILTHLERMNTALEQWLYYKLDVNISSHLHFIFLSERKPAEFIQSDLLKCLTLVTHLKDFHERPYEERQEIILKLFAKEEKRLNKEIFLSTNVVYALQNLRFERNIQELVNIIRLTIAQADKADDEAVYIHTYNLPIEFVNGLDGRQEQAELIRPNDHFIYRKADVLMEYFNMMIEQMNRSNLTSDELSRKFGNLYNQLLEKMIEPNDSQSQGSAFLLVGIIDSIVQKRFINIPGSFSYALAKILHIYTQYARTFQHWENDHQQDLEAAKQRIEKEFVVETIITQQITEAANRTMEIRFPNILQLFITVVLYRYNTDLSKRKTFGIIVCHGHSTASSMADAVNALVDSYVFDAINMPLDTTVDLIKEVLHDKVSRINRFADVIIMVDMGSLEQLEDAVDNRNFAIVNNVSTKIALDVGNKIRNGISLNDMFSDVDMTYQAEYRIIHRKQKDVIYFTSQSGMETAQRTADLFVESLPIEIDVECRVIPFDSLEQGQQANYENVLFLIGTEKPSQNLYEFIPLEGMISNHYLEIIQRKLQAYLSEAQLMELALRIRRNFTLINLVQYLTILNPQTLLDETSVAVDILQKRCHFEISGGRLIGLYIHICCLVERLVTKLGVIKEDMATKAFVQEHQRFIKDVHESFKQLTKRYHITIPDTEMKYIYSFMEAEEDEGKIEEL